jgi:hypothetical protein
MYLRVDPSRSAGTDLFVMEKNADFDKLKSHTQIECLQGQHFNLPSAILIESQAITCIETASNIFTMIYKI